MKTLPLLLVVGALSLLGGGLMSGLLASQRAAAEAPAQTPAQAPDLARLAGAVEDLRQDQRALREAFNSLSLQAASPAAAATVSLGDIDGALARYMDGRQEQEAARAASAPGAAGKGAPAAAALDLDDAMAQLLDPALGQLERETLWKQVRDAGLMDEAIAVFEARARARPDDPALQVDLARAYIQKIFEVGGGPLASVWANKADTAYDTALTLDPQNWDARFSKAVSLSFWPPIFGKQAEAISQFETLVGQQKNQAPQPQFAQTYLWLGNLYMQSGKGDLAQQTWSAGLQLFPDNADLQGKLPPH